MEGLRAQGWPSGKGLMVCNGLQAVRCAGQRKAAPGDLKEGAASSHRAGGLRDTHDEPLLTLKEMTGQGRASQSLTP